MGLGIKYGGNGISGSANVLGITDNIYGSSANVSTAQTSTASLTVPEAGRMLVIAIADRYQYANKTTDYNPSFALNLKKNSAELNTILSQAKSTYESDAVRGSVRYVKAALVDAKAGDTFNATVTVSGQYQRRGVQLLIFKLN